MKENNIPKIHQDFRSLCVTSIEGSRFFENHYREVLKGPFHIATPPILFGWNNQSQQPLVYFPSIEIGGFYFQGNFNDMSHFLTALLNEVVSFENHVSMIEQDLDPYKTIKEIVKFLEVLVQVNRNVLKRCVEDQQKTPAKDIPLRLCALNDNGDLCYLESVIHHGDSGSIGPDTFYEHLEIKNLYHNVRDVAKDEQYLYVLGKMGGILRTPHQPGFHHQYGDLEVLSVTPKNYNLDFSDKIYALPKGRFAITRVVSKPKRDGYQRELCVFTQEGSLLCVFVFPSTEVIHRIVGGLEDTLFIGIHDVSINEEEKGTLQKYARLVQLVCDFERLEDQQKTRDIRDTPRVFNVVEGNYKDFKSITLFKSHACIRNLECIGEDTIALVLSDGQVQVFSALGELRRRLITDMLTPKALPLLKQACLDENHDEGVFLDSDTFYDSKNLAKIPCMDLSHTEDYGVVGDLDGMVSIVSNDGTKYQKYTSLHQTVRRLFVL